MIINGGSYRAAQWWADHLQSEENDRARVVKSWGFRSENILDMLREIEAQAKGTRCENFFYQMNLNPPGNERLTETQWDRAREIAEKHHGFTGQPYFVVEHSKNGRVHQHIIWSRIDLENMRAISDSKDARKNHAIAREIEREFGLQQTIGPYDREPGTPRPKRAPEPWEMYRGMKSKIDPREITAEVTELFKQSDNGKSFHAALEQHGYQLVTGRRGLLIIDSAGKDHSLARRIEGINTKELNAFMRDVDRQSLPTLEQGKAQYQDRKIAGLEADRDTVRREIQWEEALAKAAIEKEKIERNFAEPKQSRKEVRRQQEKHWPTIPPQAEDKHWMDFEKAGREAARDKRPENLKGEAAKVWKAWRQSHTSKDLSADAVWPNPRQSTRIGAKAFAAALDDKGIAFAVVTKQEAERSHREAEFAKAVGNYAPRFEEGEIALVTEQRPDYRRNGEIIQPRRVHKLDQSLANKFLAALDNRSQLQGIDATKQALQERAQQRSAQRQSVRLENATKKRRTPPERAAKAIRVPPVVTRAPLRAAGKAFDLIGNAFEAILAPKLTPEQMRQGEKATQKREADAEHSIDLSQYTALHTQERQSREQEQEAERRRHRERDGGGRER